MQFESDIAKASDDTTAIITETNFENSIIQLLLITKTALRLKLEKLDKNSQGCAINNYRGGISSVQALNFCPVSDKHSWLALDWITLSFNELGKKLTCTMHMPKNAYNFVAWQTKLLRKIAVTLIQTNQNHHGR